LDVGRSPTKNLGVVIKDVGVLLCFIDPRVRKIRNEASVISFVLDTHPTRQF